MLTDEMSLMTSNGKNCDNGRGSSNPADKHPPTNSLMQQQHISNFIEQCVLFGTTAVILCTTIGLIIHMCSYGIVAVITLHFNELF
jgi:hypothetical protein